MMRRSSWPRAFTTFLCGVSLVACGGHDAGDEGDAPAAVVNAKTAVVRATGFTETLGAIGTVTGRPGHVATLSAPAAARIARVDVAVGQTVAPGTALVELEQTGFTASASGAAAALRAAEQGYERTKRLIDEGIAPRKDLEQAAADLARARGEASTASRALALSIVRSPISGVVTRVNAIIGATADPAQPLVEVADPRAMDVVLSVTPSDAARVRVGAIVSLSAGEHASGEPLGTARVADVSAAVDTVTRAVAVRAEAPTTRRPLRLGETVFGQIAVATHPNAIVVPVEALVPEGDGMKVFVVDANGVAHARPVTVGGRNDAEAEITSGLRAGERVVTYGAYGMEDSAKVMQLPAKP